LKNTKKRPIRRSQSVGIERYPQHDKKEDRCAKEDGGGNEANNGCHGQNKKGF
jgi:hypothetical protein